MAWPDGTPAWLKNQWGVLSGQVSARATTAQIFQSLRAEAAAHGNDWGPRGALIVGQLRSVATRIRNASEQVTRDGMTGSVLAQHIAEAPWSRSPIQQSLAPRFMVRALVSSANPEAIAGVAGVPSSLEQWVTHFMPQLPNTLDDLTQQITERSSESGSPPAPVTAVLAIEILRE